jgi:hypothetical protein
MTDEELLMYQLRNPPVMSMALNRAHLYRMMHERMSLAADRIEQLVKERDTIRETALREAAVVATALSSEWWAEYKNIHSPHRADPHYQGMSDGADDVAHAILKLIGET